MDVSEVERQARKELEEESFREAVEMAKTKLKERKSFLSVIFPFKLLIVRR